MPELTFNDQKYEVKQVTLGERTITYRAFEQIPYCKNPVSQIQKLNLYVPEGYYHQETIHGYDLNTAPIIVPTTVGGYMQGPAMEVGIERFTGQPNIAFEALSHGYVVMSPGIRGRNTGAKSDEFFVGGDGNSNTGQEEKMVGRAPALIVDLKAALRYMRHNKGLVPGDVEKMITTGISAGGALSALAGATGNASDYESYLKEIGAAKERDDVFAANCYCPIHNLENADAAYEWLFHKEHTYHMMRFELTPEGPKLHPLEGELSKEQLVLSKELKNVFPDYVNSLALKDEKGTLLTLDENGEGTFKEYVKSFVLKSATAEMATHDSGTRLAALAVPGSEIDKQEYIKFVDGQAVELDFDGYVKKITRMKGVPAFDDLNGDSPENQEFGDEQVFARHFTKAAFDHSKKGLEMADPVRIQMLNPVAYVGKCDTTKHWRIRHGAFDRDTSIAIPVILGTILRNCGYEVDLKLPWGLPHSGDYDLVELFVWVDGLAKMDME